MEQKQLSKEDFREIITDTLPSRFTDKASQSCLDLHNQSLRSMSIGFAEWISNQGLFMVDGDYSEWGTGEEFSKRFTTDQLYEKYFQHLQQNNESNHS